MAATLLLAAGSGCGGITRATAGLVGCPADKIQISDQRGGTWTATCRGVRYFCAMTETGGYSSQLSCTPEQGSTVASSGYAPVAAPAGAPATSRHVITRGYDEAHDAHLVKASIRLPNRATLHLGGAPAMNPGVIQMQLETPPIGTEPCGEFEIAVNGVRHAVTTLEEERKGFSYQWKMKGALDLEWFRPLAGTGAQVTLRSCKLNVPFDAAQMQQLQKFLVIYGEIAAEAQQADAPEAPGGNANAPSSVSL